MRYRVRDDETRIVEFADDQGSRYRLLLGRPCDGKANMSLWDYDKDIRSFQYNIENINSKLNLVHIELKKMIDRKGNTRTIV